MSAKNFTPIADKASSKKKSSTKVKIISLLSLFVMIVGVGVGYVMVKRGFVFQPKAASHGGHLDQYVFNGSCFTKLSGAGITKPIDFAALYQCPGKIHLYGGGCQGALGKRTRQWNHIQSNGVSQVCIEPNGESGPKDANGCFTQQLDLDNGSGGSPEAFYSFDKCGTSDPKPPATPPPADPKPPATPPTDTPPPPPEPPTATPTPTPTPTPPPGSTPTPTPTPTITIPTSTPPPASTPTPTIPACVNPGTPANVHINCPLCDQSSSN